LRTPRKKHIINKYYCKCSIIFELVLNTVGAKSIGMLREPYGKR
jgi:hypothetical protein